MDEQLPLPLKLETFARFETFVGETDGALVAHLGELAAGRRGDIVWVWGARGSGKSHLLQAACRSAGLEGRRAMYLPLGRVGWTSDVLTGLDSVDLVAVDDVDRVAARPAWERALFSLLEAFLSRRGALLLAAAAAPAAAGFELADLASRAAGAVVYRLEPLSESGRRRALVEHARLRGIELDSAAADYLLRRVARDMRELNAWLERLDRAALAARRRVTIPLIREVLAADAG